MSDVLMLACEEDPEAATVFRSESVQYDVTIDGTTIVGPVTAEQLQRGVEAGKVPRGAKVRPVGTETWRPVLDVLGPVQAMPPAASPPAAAQGEPVHSLSWALAGAAALVLAVFGGVWAFVPDYARPSYERCVEQEAAGDFVKASESCEAAVKAD